MSKGGAGLFTNVMGLALHAFLSKKFPYITLASLLCTQPREVHKLDSSICTVRVLQGF